MTEEENRAYNEVYDMMDSMHEVGSKISETIVKMATGKILEKDFSEFGVSEEGKELIDSVLSEKEVMTRVLSMAFIPEYVGSPLFIFLNELRDYMNELWEKCMSQEAEA